MNINNFEGKVKIKFVFTFYFMSFWPVQLEWLGGNQKNVWLFGLIYIIHLPIPKIFFKFPKICGAEEWTYLNSSHKFIQCNSFLKCTCDIG